MTEPRKCRGCKTPLKEVTLVLDYCTPCMDQMVKSMKRSRPFRSSSRPSYDEQNPAYRQEMRATGHVI